MKSVITSILLLIFANAAMAQSTFVRFETNKGNVIVMLYDKTPKHKAMFLKEIKKGSWDNAAFNRVIKAFVSQAGELDDTISNRENRMPALGAKRFPAEIKTGLIHKKGALGAGRDDNPEKASYYTQIYLVTGRVFADAQLDALETKRKIKLPPAHREIYKSIGGVPHLDGDYTVFGEIVSGMDIADTINSVATDKNDVPLAPVLFSISVLSGKDTRQIKASLKP